MRPTATMRPTAADRLAAALDTGTVLRVVAAAAAPPDPAPAGQHSPPAGAGPVTVAGLAVPWDVWGPLNGWGDRVRFAAGSLDPSDRPPSHVKLLRDHRAAIGFATSFTVDAAGLRATFAIPADELADPDVARVVRQLRNGVRDALSVGVAVTAADHQLDLDADRLDVTVTAGELVEVSTVELPRFRDARVDLVAALPTTDPTCEDPVTITDTAPTTVTASAELDPVDVARAQARTVTASHLRPATSPWPTFAAYAQARFRSEAPPLLLAALADQVPGDNPGLMAPSWLAGIVGIIGAGRPFITALGGAASAGETGMSIEWPYYDGDLWAGVAVQAAPKTEIASGPVSIKKGSEDLHTFAGGSDIALQLLERSSPAYLDAYLRIMSIRYANTTDRAAVVAATATGTGVVEWDDQGGADALARAMFEASVAVERATGLPASVVAMGSQAFIDHGPDVLSLMAPRDNTAGAAASAATLNVNLAGLTLTHVPGAAPLSILVTNRAACAWVEDGPRTIAADDVARLGRDVAVYGFANLATFVPAGLVKIVPA